MIKVNSRLMSLEKALYHLVERFLQHPNFEVYGHSKEVLTVSLKYKGDTGFSEYSGTEDEMLPLLQLTQIMLGKKMECVPEPLIYTLNITRWDEVQGLQGLRKARLAMSHLGGGANDPYYYSMEKMYEAFAWHIQDQRVTMDEVLKMKQFA